MKSLCFSLLTLFLSFSIGTVLSKAQTVGDPEAAVIKKVADNILSKTTYDYIVPDGNRIIKNISAADINESVRINSPYNEWRYWNGVLNIAMLRIGETFNEKKYKDFAIRNYEFAFDNLQLFRNFKGSRTWQYPFSTLIKTEQLDDCGAEAAGLVDVNQVKPRKDYSDYLYSVGSHMLTKQTRLADRTYSRIVPHNMTIWGDDLYMSIVFLSRMGKWTGEKKYFDDAIFQVENMTKYLYDPKEELYYHGWYDDLKVNSVAHWGRCNGWIMMAQIELLDHLPVDYPRRNELLRILGQQIRGIAKYQDVTGLWHQLLDKNDSYLETSCTAMFTYSIAKAVNNRWIDKGYITIAFEGWEGVKKNIQDDGLVKNICMGTGIQNFTGYYYKRETPLNDIHGLGAIILAGDEIIKFRKDNPDFEFDY